MFFFLPFFCRQCQLAVESDRRRLLMRCLNEWQLWCRTEREQRELLAQQQETRCKMAALINAASTGKLKARVLAVLAPPEAPKQAEIAEKVSTAFTIPHFITNHKFLFLQVTQNLSTE